MKCIVDGLAIEYALTGEGPDIVMLHGWGTSAQDLKQLGDKLAVGHRVITMDFPGFGGSELPHETWGVREYAVFLQHFLKKIGTDPMSFQAMIAHSFGGRVAIMAESESLVRPVKNIFIGIAGIRHSASARNLAYRLAAKSGKVVFSLPGLKKVGRRAQDRLYQTAGSSDYKQAGPMKAIFAKVIGEDLQVRAAMLDVPTLLIWGESDTSSPLADGRRFHELISGSRLEIIEHAGHFVYHDDLESVVALTQEFIT